MLLIRQKPFVGRAPSGHAGELTGGGEGKDEEGKGRRGRGIPLRIKTLAMALLLSTKSSHCKDHRKVPKCPAGTSKSIQPDS